MKIGNDLDIPSFKKMSNKYHTYKKFKIIEKCNNVNKGVNLNF